MEFEDQLATAMRASVETLTPPVTDLVSAGVARGRRRQRRNRIMAAGVVAVVALAGAGAVLANRDSSDDPSTIAAPVTACHSVVSTGVLPTWARDGFSEPEPTAPHVLSAKGDFTAILFGATLHAPPAPDVEQQDPLGGSGGRCRSAGHRRCPRGHHDARTT